MTALESIRRLADDNAKVERVEYGGDQIRVTLRGMKEHFSVPAIEVRYAKYQQSIADQMTTDELKWGGFGKKAADIKPAAEKD